MAALKEIKARIASVGGTLKITSAMKMVASAKLHHVQSEAEALAVYERQLGAITEALFRYADEEQIESPLTLPHKLQQRAVVVAVASDGSLCGGFNAEAIRQLEHTLEVLRGEGFQQIEVWPVGEKMLAHVRKSGLTFNDSFHTLSGHHDYAGAVRLADRLMEDFEAGRVDRVVLVYNHYASMSRQTPRSEMLLPLEARPGEGQTLSEADYICEPSPRELLRELLPLAVRTRMYEVLLDSATAEHAARTVAMQTASDNAQELLDELKLFYNKQRQQAITNELADIGQAD